MDKEMDTTAQARQLITAGFHESPQWFNWFFANVFTPENAFIHHTSDKAAACLLMEPYSLKIDSKALPLGYISCATTARPFRGHGHMASLIGSTLRHAATHALPLVSLIPASEALYFYYSKFGFSTVFYADELRYTSAHSFPDNPQLLAVEPNFLHFHMLQQLRASCVMHSERQFNNILADNALSNGITIALTEASGTPAAMLFATVGQHAVQVADILATSPQNAQAALARLRRQVPDKMIIVQTPPSESTFMFKSRGMLRITNALQILQTLAETAPHTRQVIRVRDSLIEQNNGTFLLSDGHAGKMEPDIRLKPTLDVDISVLAKIIFNSPRISHVFSLPTFRPFMSLMLE